MKTVFITGASSGIGKATALLFQKKGWNVVATMRNIEDAKELADLPDVLIEQCDVTDLSSIDKAISAAIEKFGNIDVLVNNAGFYTIGLLEAANQEQISKQIDTNLKGLIQVTQAVLPVMRKQKSGVIINLSSIAGKTTVPLQTLYHATKWGVEGFSESLQYEVRKFGIQIKLIEPGVIRTDFYGRSMMHMKNKIISEYGDYEEIVMRNIMKNAEYGSSPEGVAETIYLAASDDKKKMRYPTGKNKQLLILRKIMPQCCFASLMSKIMEN